MWDFFFFCLQFCADTLKVLDLVALMISDFSDLGFLACPHGGWHKNLLCMDLDVRILESTSGTHHDDNTEISGLSPLIQQDRRT